MSKKRDLKRAIAESAKEIENLEKKRLRSQTSIMEAMIESRQPSDVDTEYFHVYTSLIKLERENLQKLKKELDELK